MSQPTTPEGADSDASTGTPPTASPTASKKGKPARKVWLSPAGISALAAVLAAVVAVAGLLLQRAEPTTAPPTTEPAGTAPSTTPAAEAALFVYGSSMPGMSRYQAISAYVVRSARDTVRGSLYDSGLGYPMARFDGQGEIRGFVLWLDAATAQAALTEMTRVEAGLFHPVQVRTGSGVTAQAYEWIGSTDGYPRIDAWDGTTADYGATVAWTDLDVGACFQPSDTQVITSWCGAPHAWEAFHAGTADSEARARTACTDAFDPFVGRPAAKSGLLLRTFHEPDDGRYLCAVGMNGETSPGGSLRGADR
ncbi:MAG: gamma-glutamylcyclotransferase [Propionibacteriaceae bacterium]|nr:gamma-glutamylcyclotransferase [Propionibacteriaceae bacterium]